MKKRGKSRGRCADQRRKRPDMTAVCCWCETAFLPGEVKWVLRLMGEAIACHAECRPCFERWLDDESA